MLLVVTLVMAHTYLWQTILSSIQHLLKGHTFLYGKPSSTPGVSFNYVKGVVFGGSGRGLQTFSRARKRARPYEPPFTKS